MPAAWQASADVHRVLGEDHRIVVRERDALAARVHARPRAIASGRRRIHRAGPCRATSRCPSSGRTCRRGCSPRCRRTARAMPGRKWLSGFFSIGIDAESRRAPVGREHHRVAPRARTKQAPRWPSCSRQSRGQRSHWMRPSSSLRHQRPGCRSPCTPIVQPRASHDISPRCSARACTSGCQKRAGNRALRRSSQRKSSGSGMLSHTCGRKVARTWPYSR